MYKIRLSDGAEFPARWCGAAGGVLTACVVTDKTFVEIAQTFGDPEKTETISFIYGEMQSEFKGYGDLVVINASTAGEYMISLRISNEG